jgi:addiction module HigA family antidote
MNFQRTPSVARPLAKTVGISSNRIAEIAKNQRRITAEMALRLALFFGNSPEFWLDLQGHYDLKLARENLSAMFARIKRNGQLAPNGL